MSEKKEEPHFPVNTERLKLLLLELPMNQSVLANQIGASESEISKWKSGDRMISSGALQRLCKVSCCSSAWLLGLTDHRQPEITWRQMDITLASGKIGKTAQTLLLALLEAVIEQKNPVFQTELGKLFLEALTEKHTIDSQNKINEPDHQQPDDAD